MKMNISSMLQKIPADALVFLLRQNLIRDIALKKAVEELYYHFVLRNEENRPRGVQEWRYLLVKNLLLTIDRAFAEGRISRKVCKALIGNFVGAVILGEKERTDFCGYFPTAFLTISPTAKCNLYCKGCYAASSAGNSESLNFDIFDRMLKEKKELWQSRLTVISGGEPLVYNDKGRTLFDILEGNRDNYFMMYTNGTLITEEVAERLADLGNITPAISVEGFEKETDERRGKGVYKRIEAAMDNLRKAGVPFGISITATRQNAEIVLSDELIDHYFHEKGAFYGWIFQYMPIGRSFTLDLMVTPEQRLCMFQREQEIIKDKELFMVDFWNGGPYALGCISAGRRYFYIDWNGNIAPCVFFPYYLANIYDIYRENKTLNDVYHSPYFQSIRKWQDDYGYAQPPHNVDNLIVPCLIRDHYAEAYELISRFDAKPSDANAEAALKDAEYRKGMTNYGKAVKSLTQDTWEKEFLRTDAGEAEMRKLSN
jgi:MoaA/NifB/PqqE/SkfB family radical SAM enzyme